MAKKDLYKILGVAKTATVKEIKKAYYALAKKHHPDVNGGEESEVMREANFAYTLLSDPERKKLYDETGYYDEGTVKSTEEEALEFIAQGMSAMVNKYGKWLMFVDFLGEIGKSMNAAAESCEKDKDKAEHEIASLQAVSAMMKKIKKDDNLISELLERMANKPEQVIRAAERFLVIVGKAQKILEEYKFTPQDMDEEQKKEFEEAMAPPSMGAMLASLMGGGR